MSVCVCVCVTNRLINVAPFQGPPFLGHIYRVCIFFFFVFFFFVFVSRELRFTNSSAAAAAAALWSGHGTGRTGVPFLFVFFSFFFFWFSFFLSQGPHTAGMRKRRLSGWRFYISLSFFLLVSSFSFPFGSIEGNSSRSSFRQVRSSLGFDWIAICCT